ncbi:hypothetical protein HW555_005632 [Spodoptera exigua]|uniref:Uncharacterized protein n=1 Tax=Spodoptera exigua TaxID=7107 RepID=A0A835L6C5_SPOEX|nr:hypothetical protein HW555_005632 [Spodoptera exigua]
MSKMSVPLTKLDIPVNRLTVVCRGCLAESGEMKNIYEWGINDDYFRVTAIETSRRSGISELLCSSCEAALISCKQFQDRCQLSDKILKSSLSARTKNKTQKTNRNQVTCVLQNKRLELQITAPKTDARIRLPCPYNCEENFFKKSDLQGHLKKTHNLPDNFDINMQYYCSETTCVYHVNSNKKKWFSGRKFLNQHIKKVHKTKSFLCNDCGLRFSTETDFQRHSKSCNYVFLCRICDVKYNTNEKLMVHLKRKHPTNQADSKKSFATQIPEPITNDVALHSWAPKDYETKTDEISTQVGFEDLLIQRKLKLVLRIIRTCDGTTIFQLKALDCCPVRAFLDIDRS